MTVLHRGGLSHPPVRVVRLEDLGSAQHALDRDQAAAEIAPSRPEHRTGPLTTTTLADEFGTSRRSHPGGCHTTNEGADMAVIEDVRPLGVGLERSYEAYVRGGLRFRVKQLVYAGFSPDGRVMGFAFPREERAALVASEPDTFRMPSASEMRFNWVHADLAALDPTEARELVVDAWRMVVPDKLSRAYDLAHPDGPG